MFYQLLIFAFLYHTSFVEHVNLIAILDRINPVCNWNRCSVLHNLIQGSLHFLFIRTVKGWGCLVQKQYWWISQDRPGYSYSLFLSTRNMWAFDSNILFEAWLACFIRLRFGFFFSFLLSLRDQLFFAFDKRKSIWYFSCTDHLFFRNIFHIVNDIVLEASVKKNRFLAYDSKTASQVMDVVIFDIHSINQYLTLAGLIESLEKLENCWLSTSGVPNKSYLFAHS